MTEQSRTDQIPLFVIPRSDPHGATLRCDPLDSRPTADEEMDPVHTYEFADHSLEVDRQLRSQQR